MLRLFKESAHRRITALDGEWYYCTDRTGTAKENGWPRALPREKKPIIVSLYEILKNNPAVGIPWHYVMAGAVYATVPLVILFISIRNYITEDLTSGAIK